MAPKRRLSPAEITAIREAIIAMQTLSDYAPVSAEYSAASLAKLADEMDAAQEAEVRAKRGAAQAREKAITSEVKMYDSFQRAKGLVVAQYGPDSSVVEAFGLKKKSDYKRPVRRPATKPTP